MPIPETKYSLVDNSAPIVSTTVSAAYPVLMTVISSDKGPEKWRLSTNPDFFKSYGTDISFARHGQPLLQAAASVSAGAQLFVKRVVAPDSALANLAVIARVSSVSVQLTDSNGNALYKDASTGDQTIVATNNTAIMVNKASIKYDCQSVKSASSLASITASINSGLDITGTNGVFSYPLFIISDNGRGVSAKKIRITPNYADSKYLTYLLYTMDIIENDTILETLSFTFNPSIISNSLSTAIDAVINTQSLQLTSKFIDDNYTAFIDKIASISGLTTDVLKESDLLFAKTKKNVALSTVVLDASGFNFSYIYGIDLLNGSNGSFGESPYGTTAWAAEVLKAFNGEYSNDIYDLDNYKIDAIIDANYPASIKESIAALAIFRTDAIYLRDLGLGLYSSSDILAAASNYTATKYAATYHNSYDIIDPYTKKQITVTIGYALATLIVSHFNNGRTRPFAGQLYNMTISNIVEGTVNFIPISTPTINQKEELYDAQVNYATYYDGVFTIETLLTSQTANTQLSFINNILGIQQVAKAVRSKCPKIRYSFITGSDLQTYERDVTVVLNNYTANFNTLVFSYTGNTTSAASKEFDASIAFTFKDFVQTEYFTLYANLSS